MRKRDYNRGIGSVESYIMVSDGNLWHHERPGPIDILRRKCLARWIPGMPAGMKGSLNWCCRLYERALGMHLARADA